MRINVNENTILKAVGSLDPVKSSFAKLVKETGMARNEVTEVVAGLKKIGYVNTTPAHEVYLKADGRKYLGLDVLTSKGKTSTLKDNDDSGEDSYIKSVVAEKDDHSVEQHGVLTSIDEQAIKLNKPVIKIVDCDLKGQALAKLADLMSDDIAELLLDIKADLERVAA